MCKVSSSTYKVVLAINKCSSNLIFAYRYKTVNKRRLILSKRAYFYSIFIVAISAFQILFDVFYFTLATKDGQERCLFLKINFKKHSFHVLTIALCFTIVTIMQTVILVEIVKPIYKHLNNTSRISNRSLKFTLYRVVIFSLLFSMSDFFFLIIQFIMVKTLNRPMPIVLITNVNLNLISLVCSYKNYKTRLFSFSQKTQNQQVDNTKQQSQESKAKSSRYATSKLSRSEFVSNLHRKTRSSIGNLREIYGSANCQKQHKETLKRFNSF